MPKHLRLPLVGVSLSLAAMRLLAAEPGDLLVFQVMFVAPDVTFRNGPSLRASIAENPTGGALRLTSNDSMNALAAWEFRACFRPANRNGTEIVAAGRSVW